VKFAADHALVGDRIVGLADLREQKKLDVEKRKGRQDHEIGRLLPFLAAGVDEGDAGRALADRSVLIRVTSELSRSEKFDLRTRTGNIVVCGLALDNCRSRTIRRSRNRCTVRGAGRAGWCRPAIDFRMAGGNGL